MAGVDTWQVPGKLAGVDTWQVPGKLASVDARHVREKLADVDGTVGRPVGNRRVRILGRPVEKLLV